jgi:hypothetical protein
VRSAAPGILFASRGGVDSVVGFDKPSPDLPDSSQRPVRRHDTANERRAHRGRAVPLRRRQPRRSRSPRRRRRVHRDAAPSSPGCPERTISAIPELRHAAGLRILEQISARIPTLDSTAGWNVAFGRELNATDTAISSRRSTANGHGRPVLEGKQNRAVQGVRSRAAGTSCAKACASGFRANPRLAYTRHRGATNRVTLIAAVVPADAVTTHTLFAENPAVRSTPSTCSAPLLNRLRRQLPGSVPGEHARDRGARGLGSSACPVDRDSPTHNRSPRSPRR